MAEKVEVDIEVNSNLEPTIANLRALKKQLRETAAGSAEFNKVTGQIRDMDDAIKDASAGADDFAGFLEGASGPLGQLGKGIRGAEKSFSSFNAALKTSIIGILVAAIGGLVAAFSQSEEGMKKLQPIFIAFEKILGGIFKAFEPVLDMFIELAMQALPFITKGIGMFYSGLFTLFSLVKNVGLSVGKILKGVFTLDFDSLKEGAAEIGKAFTSVASTFDETYKRFEEGTNAQTKTEKENAEERQKLADEAAKKREEAAAAADKLREERLQKNQAADAVELEAFKATLTERERAEYEAGERLREQRKVLAAAGRTDTASIENEYRLTLAAIKKKADDEEAKVREEKDKKDKEALQKKLSDERALISFDLQTRIEQLDAINASIEGDFQRDNERLEHKKVLLQQQRDIDLQGAEDNALKKLEIEKKYTQELKNISDEQVRNEQNALLARQTAQLQFVAAVGGAVNAIGGLFKKGSAAAKTAALVDIAIGTGVGFINALDIAQKSAKATGPAAAFAFPIFYATQVAAVLSAASRARAILRSGGSGGGASGGGGGGRTSIPASPPPTFGGAPAAMGAPQIQTPTTTNPASQIAQTIGNAQNRPIVAQVVSQAVSSQQALDRRNNGAATFGG